MESLRKAAVIGAGVMGSGIAAHLANAGVEVALLDIEAAVAAAAIARQVKAGGFMESGFAARVTPGAVDADLGAVADADWIIEAVAERLDVKRDLYTRIEAARKPGSIVSSNTSTIPLGALTEGLPDRFGADFLVTHFFNPPRAMRLMELVTGPRTRPEVAATIRDFADRRLGKAVVACRDTPGFIANRIGNFWMAAAVNEAIALGLDVEVADAALSGPFGIPRTGIFALSDLVGIDVIALVWRSLHATLPAGDPLRQYPAEPALIARMIGENRLGRKTGAGFFRVSADRRTREATDLLTGEYRAAHAPESDSLTAAGRDARALMMHPGVAGRYAAAVMEKTLAYAAALAPEIIPETTGGPDAVDVALRTGYGWAEGPFELIDRLGAAWLADRIAARGMAVPPYLAQGAALGGFYAVEGGRRVCLPPEGPRRPVTREEGVVTLADLRLAGPAVETWEGGSLWSLGDGVACFEIRSKMNTLGPEVLSALEAALARSVLNFRALVIGSDAPDFSAGADMRAFLAAVEAEGVASFGARVAQGQRVFAAVQCAPIPVVGAAAGRALGGGCELLLHCHAIQAHAELSMGLVETRIGLVPAWGGCKEMLLRFAETSADPVEAARATFGLIAAARVSGSAFEARRLGLLRETDGITMNRDRLLADAKARALMLTAGALPRPPAGKAALSLSGPAGEAALMGALAATDPNPHDRVVGAALIGVLTGGVSADPAKAVRVEEVAALECAAFLSLLAEPATIARIRHMLATGKPLRN